MDAACAPPAEELASHPALSTCGYEDAFDDSPGALGGRFGRYADTVQLSKVGKGYQPAGYWGADDGADPNDMAARSEWQEVDTQGNILRTSATKATEAACAQSPVRSALQNASPAAAAVEASPVAASPAQMHPALAPGGFGDDNGGFGSASTTPEYTGNWGGAKTVKGDAFEVHEDTELLSQRTSSEDEVAAGAHRAPSTGRFSTAFPVHEDTELLDAAACAKEASRFSVREDTECLQAGDRANGSSESVNQGHSNAGASTKGAQMAARQRATAHPAIAPQQEASFSVREDTELLSAQQHPALSCKPERSGTFEVRQDTELLTGQHPALTQQQERKSVFEVRQDTELLTGQHPANMAQAECTSMFGVRQDTELLTGQHPALASTRSRASVFDVRQDTELLAGQHPALGNAKQHTSAFEVRPDTELLTGQHPALAAQNTDADDFAVHEDTELVPQGPTPGLHRAGTVKNAEAVKAPAPAGLSGGSKVRSR